MKIQYQSSELIIFESSLFRTTITLIIGEDYLLLVDPNWLPIELDYIEQTIDQVGEGRKKYLLFTHSDYDHIIGYGQFKDYTTIASENFVNSFSKAQVLKEIERFDDAYYVQRKYKIEYPQIDKVIAGDGEELVLGADAYVFYQARGHNHDGILTYNTTKKILVIGDYLCNVEFPYIYDSIQLYKETLAKCEKLINECTPKILVPGHGDYTADKVEMLRRIDESRHYIEMLLESVRSGQNFDFEALMSKYDFPIIMKDFHQNNMKVAEKECVKLDSL